MSSVWKTEALPLDDIRFKLGWQSWIRTSTLGGNSSLYYRYTICQQKTLHAGRVEKASVQKRLIIPPFKRIPALCRWISGRGRGPLMGKREHKSILSYFPGMSTPLELVGKVGVEPTRLGF